MTFTEYIQKARQAGLKGQPRIMKPRQPRARMGEILTLELIFANNGVDYDFFLTGEFDEKYQDEKIGPVIIRSSGPNGEKNAEGALGGRFFIEDVSEAQQ